MLPTVKTDRKTAWIFQHVPFEGPGAFASRLLSFGYTLRTHRWWEASSPPDLSEADLVIAMGGPMSVNDEEEHPWLQQEKEWLRQALNAELPLMGICLGAQCMASALGAKVTPNPEREIGWWPVTACGQKDPEPLTVLHWHGETFDLPDGAVHLEQSEACLHQSFQWGERALGLQYHLEATRDSLTALIEHSRHEMMPGPYVQTEEQLWAGWRAHHRLADLRLSQLLDRIRVL
jgi:GMP synthase-like glutamine amidotransferase